MRDIRILFVFTALAAILLTGRPAMAQDYILGEGDLLKITVYQNDDLTTEARVSGNGMISVPLIGKMKVAGETPGEVEQKIVQKLSQGYIIDPHVTVFVEEYKSKRVTILGEVAKPGVYELTANASILEIISKAGGLTDKAGETVVIKRKKTVAQDAGAPKAVPAANNTAGADGAEAVQTAERSDPANTYIKLNLKELMEKGNMAENAYVQDGDNIFVTKSGFIYVTGEVKMPGAYKYEEGTTVIQAIALAQGLTDKAAPGRTSLIRRIDGKDESMKVGMGFPVKPDDVISVPESFF
ncbi:MAG: SLBB domain-containing protein [Nitrospirota bacterium]